MTKVRMKEESLYPRIEKFLERNMGCKFLAKRKGSVDVGQVDVIGVREFQEKFSNNYEIICVEVKKKDFNFGKVIGQTLAYSLISHRVYLACFTKFTESQIDLASRLGVGLISINRKSGCSKVLSSHLFRPEKEKMLKMLGSMGLGECMFCNSLVIEECTGNLPTATNKKIAYEFRRKIVDGKKDKMQYLY